MNDKIRLSVFGNFENYSTNNVENYIKLINYFSSNGYKTSTAIELQVNKETGAAVQRIMPLFISDNEDCTIEFQSERINITLDIETGIDINQTKERFNTKALNIFVKLCSEFDLKLNRLALNYYISVEDNFDINSYKLSDEITEELKEVTVRNRTVRKIENENINIVIQRSNKNGVNRVIYDINTEGNNTDYRFCKEDVIKWWDTFLQIVKEINKGMK